jgi:tRNA(fMet)-specific endonuclease VapC
MARFQRLKPGEAALSVITLGELRYGAEKSPTRANAFRELDELASLMQVLRLPADAATTYGIIRAALELKGEMIGGNDVWIAAHAKATDMILVTNNERELKRVSGLKIQNWAT